MLTEQQGAELHAAIASAISDVDAGQLGSAHNHLLRLQELVDDLVPDVDA